MIIFFEQFEITISVMMSASPALSALLMLMHPSQMVTQSWNAYFLKKN